MLPVANEDEEMVFQDTKLLNTNGRRMRVGRGTLNATFDNERMPEDMELVSVSGQPNFRDQ